MFVTLDGQPAIIKSTATITPHYQILRPEREREHKKERDGERERDIEKQKEKETEKERIRERDLSVVAIYIIQNNVKRKS